MDAPTAGSTATQTPVGDVIGWRIVLVLLMAILVLLQSGPLSFMVP